MPLTENLARWLAIAPRNGARVWPHSKDRFFKAMRHAADKAKIQMETKRAATFVHLLPACGGSGREPRGFGSG